MSRRDGQASPWLRRGATQPIEWRPFAAAAFADGRPLLLVIGSATSHACHALDDEGFDDPDVARALDGYVCLRVDADERPDLDARYQPLAHRSPLPSWPLICVLAPDGTVRAAGVHWSRAALLGLAGGGADMNIGMNADMNQNPVHSDARAHALARMHAAFDPRYGGFGRPHKHPHAPALELLLDERAPWTRPAVLKTLDAMAAGGIHDQLGGGFHRYSTDDKWIVPRFEKRAQDQAGLMRVLARAFAITGEPRYAELARGAGDYVARRLAVAGGGFGCGEDCDLGAYDDAGYYTWTVDEARAALQPDEWPVAERAFDIYGSGEMRLDSTRNVLFVGGPPGEIARELGRPEREVRALLESARARLLEARDRRPRPAVDESCYAGVNADLARAFLQTADRLARPEWRKLALGALEALYCALQGGLVPHSINGGSPAAPLFWLADQAELGLAALAAFAATGDRRHLAIASGLAERIAEDFSDGGAAFFDRPRGAGGPAALALPLVPCRDGAAVSGNAAAGRLFAELAAAGGDRDYSARAAALVDALLPRVADEGVAAAGLLLVARGLP